MGTLHRYIEFLRFEACSRSFCVDVDQVLGVVTLPSSLREAPVVVPFRDETIPVHPLCRLLELEDRPSPCAQEIIVLSGPPATYGILVDWIGQIYRVPFHRAIFRFPAGRPARVKMFGIWGMVVLENEQALILEPHELLRMQREARRGEPPSRAPSL